MLDQVAPVIVSPVWLSPSSIGASHGYRRRLPATPRQALSPGERWPQGKAISRQSCVATVRWFWQSGASLQTTRNRRWLTGRRPAPPTGGSVSRRFIQCVPLPIVDWEHQVESRCRFAGFSPYSGCFDQLGLIPRHPSHLTPRAGASACSLSTPGGQPAMDTRPFHRKRH